MVKFTLNCTEIQNFDDVMSNPPSPPPHPTPCAPKRDCFVALKYSGENIWVSQLVGGL